MFTIAEISKTPIISHPSPLGLLQDNPTQAEIDRIGLGGTIDYNQEAKSISSVYLDLSSTSPRWTTS